MYSPTMCSVLSPHLSQLGLKADHVLPVRFLHLSNPAPQVRHLAYGIVTLLVQRWVTRRLEDSEGEEPGKEEKEGGEGVRSEEEVSFNTSKLTIFFLLRSSCKRYTFLDSSVLSDSSWVTTIASCSWVALCMREEDNNDSSNSGRGGGGEGGG